jgi:murein DD-endopeptidase MepM/ murein hydrolase activator NlpD
MRPGLHHRLAGAVSIVLVCALAGTDAAGPIQVAAAARSKRPGELVVLTMSVPAGIKGVRVNAFGREIVAFNTSPRTWRALVGIDLDVTPGNYPVSIEAQSGAGALQTTWVLVVRPRQFPTRRLQVDEGFVNPPADAIARIREEAREIEKVFGESARERLWRGPFVRPVPGPSNSNFGVKSIFNGQLRGSHSGVDFLSPEGTPVKAPNAGRVVLARSLYFSGDTVIIDHGLGFFSLLAHLAAIDVRENDELASGGVVGRVGATGRVTGPHLHWAVRAGAARIDPLSVLALLGPATEGPAEEARRLR